MREFPCGLHTPNKRTNRDSLMFFFDTKIDFSNLCSNNDIYWNSEREETNEELNSRIKCTKNYIRTLEPNNILIFYTF